MLVKAPPGTEWRMVCDQKNCPKRRKPFIRVYTSDVTSSFPGHQANHRKRFGRKHTLRVGLYPQSRPRKK